MAARTPEDCRSHRAGHTTHWVQWSCGQRRAHQQLPGRVVKIDAGRAIVVDLGERTVRLHHHDPVRVRDVLAVEGTQVRYQREFSLLWFQRTLLSVSSGRLGPCSFDEVMGGGTAPATTKAGTAATLLRPVTSAARGHSPRSRSAAPTLIR